MKTKYAVIALAALLVVSVIVCSGTLLPTVAGKKPSNNLTVEPIIFSNYAVLQRNIAVPVWGTGPASETVTVSFNGQVKDTTVDGSGNWMLNLDPMPALATPSDMVITAGTESITLSGIQVGEVWVATGQSNMHMSLDSINDSAPIIADADNHNIVFQQDAKVWEVTTSSNAGGFSAVGYIFAREIEISTGVPIGVIERPTSGTEIDEWTHTGGCPGNEYDEKIVPLQPYAIKGVIWYQGSADANTALDYYWQFPGLVQEWRAAWGQGDFAFYAVQGHWNDPIEGDAIVRDAQLQTMLSEPNCGIAIIVDLPPGSGNGWHPEEKVPVGMRLARPARALLYGETSLVYSSPIVDPGNSHVDGSDVIVEFYPEGIGGGLTTGSVYQPAGAPVPFKLAGADEVYHDATGQIVGDTVVVSSASVSNPVYVQYVWSFGQGNLYNAEGLPASPFSVDLMSEPTPTPGGPSPTPAPTDTPMPTATPGGPTEMHVNDIHTTDVNGTPKDLFSATNREKIYYRALIHDQFNSPVEGALVTTVLKKPDNSVWTSVEGTTGADGWALFEKSTTKPQPKGTYTVVVTNVTMTGATYNAAANVKSSHQFLVQ